MNEKYFEQLQTEITIRNLLPSTGKPYHYYIKTFLLYFGKEACEMEDIRKFLLFKKSKGMSAATLNLYNSAIRFFLRHVLHRQWDWELIPRMKVDRVLPNVLSQEEVQHLLDVTQNLKHKTMLATMCSSGLRVSEVCALHYHDISRSLIHIHVRHSKNRLDRYALLSERNLELLTHYWRECGKPTEILFPSRYSGEYLTVGSIEQVVKKSAKKAGFKKSISPHPCAIVSLVICWKPVSKKLIFKSY